MPFLSAEEIASRLEEGQRLKLFTHATCGMIQPNRTLQVIDPWGLASTAAFDLASLTKVLATTTLTAVLCAKKKLSLDLTLNEMLALLSEKHRVSFSQEFCEQSKKYTLKQLMGHVVPFPARIELFKQLNPHTLPERGELISRYLNELNAVGFSHLPEGRVIYSDVGFQLLAFYLESLCGKRFKELFESEIPSVVRANLEFGWHALVCVSTELCGYRRRRLQGEVHDENAFIFGGDCGHAGLFGTLLDVWSLLQHWCFPELMKHPLLSASSVAEFSAGTPQGDGFGGYAFRIGWDSPGQQSTSLGEGWSQATFGHWGFTGVGAWFDPRDKQGMILLTNQVYYGRDKREFRAWRKQLFNK